jgi:hypothetical protein
MWNETRLGKYLLERWYEKAEVTTIVNVQRMISRPYTNSRGTTSIRKTIISVPTKVVTVKWVKRTRYIGKVKP